MGVNVTAVFACCQAAAREPIRAARGGAIVNVASNAGKVGYPNMAPYNAGKAPVISLTRSLASEWAPSTAGIPRTDRDGRSGCSPGAPGAGTAYWAPGK